MFIIFNQEGEIEGYDKGFQFFVEQCFDEQKITSTSWINNIHKNDIHLFKKIFIVFIFVIVLLQVAE